MSKFNVGDKVRVTENGAYVDGFAYMEGDIATVTAITAPQVKVKFDGDTQERSLWFSEIELYSTSVPGLIAELAAALGHDADTTTENGILVDALAELARLRKQVEDLDMQLSLTHKLTEFAGNKAAEKPE